MGRSCSRRPSTCFPTTTGTPSRPGSTRSSTACSRPRSARWSRAASGSTDGWSACSRRRRRERSPPEADVVTDVRPVRRALLAVYDKTGVVEFARGLTELGVGLVSSGGTAATLREAGIDVTPVEEVTGFPEMLEGRVKTLHPRVHAGILADRTKLAHEEQLAEHDIEPFELVVVNLYPFRETVA